MFELGFFIGSFIGSGLRTFLVSRLVKFLLRQANVTSHNAAWLVFWISLLINAVFAAMVNPNRTEVLGYVVIDGLTLGLWLILDLRAVAHKKCTFCSETIRAQAVICRYCGRSLGENVAQ